MRPKQFYFTIMVGNRSKRIKRQYNQYVLPPFRKKADNIFFGFGYAENNMKRISLKHSRFLGKGNVRFDLIF